ncbi:sialidase family protein [Aureliella helgolandensis]|nr:sialidase family protein [Aureliella helgolandensis]
MPFSDSKQQQQRLLRLFFMFAAILGMPEVVCLAAQPLIPLGWNPAIAGDQVLGRLVTVTAPQVKGAHDAEMVITDGHAYIVAEVNDVKPGESAGWPEIYATMSIVDLETLEVEEIFNFAKSEQVFENVTLPVGACFVPRVLRKDENSLRCFFASEDPGKRQSQTWFRDFNLQTRTFAPSIHQAKLKTASGTFDMEPRHFYADAAAQGFSKPPTDAGLFLFDSFKQFDGKTYVAINNFPGKQNAIALVHDDLATFEIIGHYNEPQSENLSESAVNRLADGSWMAICRNDGGNYHFTTSKDGRKWTVGKELPSVPNGDNSKPTFDKFGDIYYLGWQESTRIHGVHRSVFNVDISRDGKTWERKYRFETAKSFQYPTFREYEGIVWLCLTQGDSSSSRKERIMFGKLETAGEFESQEGKTREPIPLPPEQTAVMKSGVKLFTDRDYTITEVPESLQGLSFLRSTIEPVNAICTTSGELFALTPGERRGAANRERELVAAGFEKVDLPEFQLFPGLINRVLVYRKNVDKGERFSFRKVVLLVSGKETEVVEYPPQTRHSEN